MSHDRIAVRAYYLTLNEGLSALDAWLKAEGIETFLAEMDDIADTLGLDRETGARLSPTERRVAALKAEAEALAPVLTPRTPEPTILATPVDPADLDALRAHSERSALAAKRSAAARKGAETRRRNKAAALAAK